MNNKSAHCILVLCLLFQSFPAYAYLDPGTGSMILQGMIGGIAAAWAVFGLYFQKIKSFFKQHFSGSKDVKIAQDDD